MHFLLDAIGNTPLVEIRHLNPNPKVRLLAKLEYFNPGGSFKDRAALAMIDAGERSGELTPEKTVIEATSGNTGIGLAMVCAVKGYRLLLAMSERASIERQKILRARGAEILLTPGHLGTDGAIEEVYRLVLENPGVYFMADQFNNPANWQAHYHGTGPEIWEQTHGDVTMLVATMGTTGTLMGLSRRLKEFNPKIRIVGVEPYLGHAIQGLKNMKEAYRPEIYDKDRLDEKANVDDEDAFEMTRQLARKEGLFVGMSSGAAMAVARKKAETLDGGTIVMIFPDGGERYLSTPVFDTRTSVGLNVFNTLSHRKEAFEPIHPGKASIYSCGPTVDGPIRLSQCRRFVFADLLCRYLAFRGYAVRHVMNITDYDDKTIAGAAAAGVALSDFTGRHIERFMADLDTLGIRRADVYPRASEHIQEMVALAATLVEKGVAYEKLRSLYFDISRFSGYGRLSGVDLDKIRLGATVDLDDYEKDNPRDFTLLRRSTLSELKRGIFTRTPWGNVRPSWHIQCVAMSMKHLGESFDIHTSGRELIFPHHENEIAIAAAATGNPLARYWMHCDNVRGSRDDAGRHSGDMPLADLLAEGHSGRLVRFWLLSTHYRKPVTFFNDRLRQAARALARMDRAVAALNGLPAGPPAYPDLDQLRYDIRNGFIAAMDDDLNVSAAMAVLFDNIRRINGLMKDRRLTGGDAASILAVIGQINTVLNVFDLADPPADAAVRSLFVEREAARARCDWQTADRLRDRLRELGIRVRDGAAPGR